MTRIYYPETNTFVISHEGRIFGARGAIAERILKRCFENNESVMIGIQPVVARKPDATKPFSKN